MLRSLIQSRPLLSIFLLALLVRLFSIASLGTYHEVPLNKDALHYHMLAISLCSGQGLAWQGEPSALVPPLYPLLLAGIYALTGSSRIGVLIFQTLLGATLAVLIYLSAEKIFSRKTALVSAFVAALYWPFVTGSLRYLSESLFLPLLIAGAYFSILTLEEKKTAGSVLAGGFLGLAALTRSVIFYFPVLIVCHLAWNYLKGRDRKLLKSGFIFILAFGLVYSPWIVRNYLVLGSPVLTNTNSGMVLYTSQFPNEGKIFGNNLRDKDLQPSDRYILSLTEVDQDHALKNLAQRELRADPFRPLRLIPLKTAYFWSPFDWEVLGQPRGTIDAWYVWIMIFCGVWLFKGACRKPALFVPLSMIAYFYLLSLAAYGSSRMRLPVEPLLVMLAAEGWVGSEIRLGRKIKTLLFSLITVSILACSFYGYELKELTAGLLSRMNLW